MASRTNFLESFERLLVVVITSAYHYAEVKRSGLFIVKSLAFTSLVTQGRSSPVQRVVAGKTDYDE